MMRTQIQLTESQVEKLESEAASKQVSKAEVVRLAIDRYFAEEGIISQSERFAHSLTVLGKFTSGLEDVSENHDEYLAEIYGTW